MSLPNRPSQNLSVAQIRERIAQADDETLAALERAYAADTRKGVKQAFESAYAKRQAQEREAARLEKMFEYESECALHFLGETTSMSEQVCIVGLDEVGRGPLAGPLAVGAVVLPRSCRIEGLNDSKKIAPEKRKTIASEVKKHALAWSVQYIAPKEIDACGMTASLTVAFRRAVKDIESQGYIPQVILLDGNPLHLDERECNVIKGDGKCASIAAASIIAKVDRDALMCEYAKQYPEYHLEACKGYASAAHIEAIRKYGLSPIHRKSFCTAFTQETLF